MEGLVDRTNFNSVLEHIRNDRAGVQWVWFVRHGHLLAEVGRRLLGELPASDLPGLFESGLVRGEPVGTLSWVSLMVLLEGNSRAEHCRCILLTPVYLVHLPDMERELFDIAGLK